MRQEAEGSPVRVASRLLVLATAVDGATTCYHEASGTPADERERSLRIGVEAPANNEK